MSGRTWDGIWIAGQLFRLSGLGELKVVTFKDPGGMSFPGRRNTAMATTGSPGYGVRRRKGKTVRSLESLQEVVHQVVLHTDLTSDSRGCFETLVGRGLSTHFMIDWDGTIYQSLDVVDEAYHAGMANQASVGIDLNNLMRNLVTEPGAPAYPADHGRAGEMARKDFRRPRSGVRRINGARVRSYGYTDPQYQALLALLKTLLKILPRIQPFSPMDERGEAVLSTLDGGMAFEGIVGHYHVSPSRWDPGPAFDWQRVFHGLAREHNAFPVELEPGKNIATLLEPDKVRAYGERVFRHIERASDGGWFPLGRRQTWRGGIHFRASPQVPVLAMFDGVLVAARFLRDETPLGHANFVVLRHEVQIPRGPDVDPARLVFFSLTMHLDTQEVDRLDRSSPEWLRALHRIHSGRTAAEEEALRGGRAEEEERGRGEGDEDDEEEDTLAARGRSQGVVPAVGPHLAALKRGEIALIPWKKDPIRVSSGEVLGRVGLFGPEDERENLVHIEVFSEADWRNAIEMGLHGRHFSPLEGDFGRDLLCRDEAVLGLFASRRQRKMRGGRLHPMDIEEVYTTEDDYTEERQLLRKVVSRHTSEWSDQVDWLGALAASEEWDARREELEETLKRSGVFRETLEQVLPFIWLNKEVAAHIGLDTRTWDGVLCHFHPVHFLLWLTYHASQRIQVISRGLSLAQLKVRIRKEEKRMKGRRQQESDGCVAALVEIEDTESSTASEVLKDWWDLKAQGEWKLEDPEE